MSTHLATYDAWLSDVKATLDSINMPIDTWQAAAQFDFRREFDNGVSAEQAAAKANRFWWRSQNQRIKQDCHVTPGCWLPSGHSGPCEQV